MNNIIKRKKEICEELAEIAENRGDVVYITEGGNICPHFGGIITEWDENGEKCPGIFGEDTFDEATIGILLIFLSHLSVLKRLDNLFKKRGE